MGLNASGARGERTHRGGGWGSRERDKGMEKHHTDEPFKLLTPETARLSAF